MTRNSCFMLSRVPSTLVSKVAAELSAVWSVTGPGWPSVPAALTAASIRPKRATIWSIRLRTSSSCRTSARMKAASAPRLRSSASSALPSASRRPDATTDAPFLAKAAAVARPMPVNAPVTNTMGLLILFPPNWFGHVGRIFQGSRSLDLDVLPEADPVINLLHPGTRRLVGPGGAPALRSTVGHVIKLHAVRANQIARRLRCRRQPTHPHRFPRKVSVAADLQGPIAFCDHLTAPNRLHGDHP